MNNNNRFNGFTMVSDFLTWKYSDRALADVFGKIKRFALMGNDNLCKATRSTIAEELGYTEKTVKAKKDLLISEGYLVSRTKEGLRNHAQILAITDKLDTEETAFWEYAEEIRNKQTENSEIKESYYSLFMKYATENKIEPFYSEKVVSVNLPIHTVILPIHTVNLPNVSVKETDDNTLKTVETVETLFSEKELDSSPSVIESMPSAIEHTEIDLENDNLKNESNHSKESNHSDDSNDSKKFTLSANILESIFDSSSSQNDTLSADFPGLQPSSESTLLATNSASSSIQVDKYPESDINNQKTPNQDDNLLPSTEYQKIFLKRFGLERFKYPEEKIVFKKIEKYYGDKQWFDISKLGEGHSDYSNAIIGLRAFV
jgi:predicted transcriptional regulator